MRREHIDAFRLNGVHPVQLKDVTREVKGDIQEGILFEPITGSTIPIRNSIPRFTQVDYVASFSEQWNRYRLVQIDRFNGTTLSRDRLMRGTKWSPEDIRGKRVLEVGCGAGRFTQVLLDAGAILTSLDGHGAVDACLSINGDHPHLCLVQADLFNMPFKEGYFDKVFCYGVLQHTPDPKNAFMSLLRPLRSGGKIAVDCYRKDGQWDPWKSKYLYRPLTRRMPRGMLFEFVEWFIPLWLPFDTFLKKIPIVRRLVGFLIPCWNYSSWPLTKQQIVEWGILDTFDALSPAYDLPQTDVAVRAWIAEAALTDVDIWAGGGMVIANAQKP